MGELNGQILGMVIVIAIFAAITPLLINMFTDLTGNIEANIEQVETENDLDASAGKNQALNVGDYTLELLSYAD